MSTEILIEGRMVSDEMLRNDRKEQQSLLPTLTEDRSLMAKGHSLCKDIYEAHFGDFK